MYTIGIVRSQTASDRPNMSLDSNRTKYKYYHWWFKTHSSTSQQDCHNEPHCPAYFRQEISTTPFLPYIRDCLSPPASIILLSYLTFFPGNHSHNK